MKYKSNEGAFSYSATWTEDIQDAATQDIGSLKRNSDKMQKTAEVFGGELLVVNATYELTTLDGEDAKDLTEEIEEAKRKYFEGMLSGFLGDNDEEE